MSRDKAQNLCGWDLCGFNPCLFFQSVSPLANVWRIFPIWWSTKHYGNHQQTILYDPVCSCKDLRSALHVISKSPFLRPHTSCHRDSLGTEDWKVGHPSFKKNLFRSIPKRKRICPPKEKDTSSSKPSISWFSPLFSPRSPNKSSFHEVLTHPRRRDLNNTDGRAICCSSLGQCQHSIAYGIQTLGFKRSHPNTWTHLKSVCKALFLTKNSTVRVWCSNITVQGGGPSEDWVAEVLEGTAIR